MVVSKGDDTALIMPMKLWIWKAKLNS
jgi:hypothetical protein